MVFTLSVVLFEFLEPIVLLRLLIIVGKVILKQVRFNNTDILLREQSFKIPIFTEHRLRHEFLEKISRETNPLSLLDTNIPDHAAQILTDLTQHFMRM